MLVEITTTDLTGLSQVFKEIKEGNQIRLDDGSSIELNTITNFKDGATGVVKLFTDVETLAGITLVANTLLTLVNYYVTLLKNNQNPSTINHFHFYPEIPGHENAITLNPNTGIHKQFSDVQTALGQEFISQKSEEIKQLIRHGHIEEALTLFQKILGSTSSPSLKNEIISLQSRLNGAHSQFGKGSISFQQQQQVQAQVVSTVLGLLEKL